MADGTLRFDTEIDESGFQKGLKRIEQAAIQTGIYFADADVLSVLWGKSRQSLYVPGRSDPGTDAAGRR